MVLEVALIDVTDPEGFEAAYLAVRSLVAETEGCHSVRMTHGIESPNRFVLLVE
jgi:heme-degrading monooxygenase HmoA